MKKIRMGLMALAAVSGIGSAFAFNKPAVHRADSKTYYAVMRDGNQIWTEVRPDLQNFSCAPGAVACTITSTSPENDVLGTTNGYPDDATPKSSTDHVYQAN